MKKSYKLIVRGLLAGFYHDWCDDLLDCQDKKESFDKKTQLYKDHVLGAGGAEIYREDPGMLSLSLYSDISFTADQVKPLLKCFILDSRYPSFDEISANTTFTDQGRKIFDAVSSRKENVVIALSVLFLHHVEISGQVEVIIKPNEVLVSNACEILTQRESARGEVDYE
jgi:hypothetical protein